jgi:biofilm PGA synthesis lipoprotein PgaB
VDFFTDIAVYLPIRGILFDDDAYVLAGERLAGAPDAGAAEKERAMRELHAEIRRAVLAWRPDCRFARNLYAPVVERGGVHPGFAQDYERTLADYDLAVVMAYARMEGHRRDHARWTAALAGRAVKRWQRHRSDAAAGASGPALAAWLPDAPPVLFKLQAYDWKTRREISGRDLLRQTREARRAGIAHLGVYPVLPDADLPARLFEGGATGAFADETPIAR